MKRAIGLSLLCVGSFSLLASGCIPVVLAGAGAGGVVASQDRSTGTALDDNSIRLGINSRFVQYGTGDMFKNVEIDVSEGRVLLTGDVDKPDTKIQAVQLAWKVSGVKEVMDEIQVNDKTGVLDYASDTWIASQIDSKLLFERNLSSMNYNVEVVNGVVYLIGIAQDQAELNKATYIASSTPGVKQVVSHMILRNDPRRTQ